MSEMPTSLAGALALLQTRLPDIRKGQTAKVKTKAGDTYSYTYAGLAAVAKDLMPLLGAVGLSFTARPTLQGGRFVLAYSLLHVDGDSMHGEYPLPSPMESSPQAVGSAVTYARRYVLCAITGVVADDDDDGQAAAHDHERRQQRRVQGPVDEIGQPETPTPDQAKTHAALITRVKQAGTEDELRALYEEVKEAFRAGSLTAFQANGLRKAIGDRKSSLPNPDAITPKTRARLFALLNQHDYRQPEERRAFATLHLEREVSSMGTLTEDEGRRLCDVLAARSREEAPA